MMVLYFFEIFNSLIVKLQFLRLSYTHAFYYIFDLRINQFVSNFKRKIYINQFVTCPYILFKLCHQGNEGRMQKTQEMPRLFCSSNHSSNFPEHPGSPCPCPCPRDGKRWPQRQRRVCKIFTAVLIFGFVTPFIKGFWPFLCNFGHFFKFCTILGIFCTYFVC